MDKAKQTNAAQEPRIDQQHRINAFLMCSAKYLGIDWPVNAANKSVSAVIRYTGKAPPFL
jgi:hypothetical protein